MDLIKLWCAFLLAFCAERVISQSDNEEYVVEDDNTGGMDAKRFHPEAPLSSVMRFRRKKMFTISDLAPHVVKNIYENRHPSTEKRFANSFVKRGLFNAKFLSPKFRQQQLNEPRADKRYRSSFVKKDSFTLPGVYEEPALYKIPLLKKDMRGFIKKDLKRGLSGFVRKKRSIVEGH